MIDLESLTAAEWLRILREQPLPNLPNVLYCHSCAKVHIYGFARKRTITCCFVRHTPLMRLGKEFWQQVSDFIKQELIDDPWLLYKVKAEFPTQNFPKLKKPLDWLRPAWDCARTPRGRPSHLALRFFIYRWITYVSTSRVSLVINKDGTVGQSVMPPIMSRTHALHLLASSDQSRSSFEKSGTQKSVRTAIEVSDYFRSLKETFEKEAIETFQKVPCLDLRELKRVLQWVKRFQSNPSFRISGHKPRRRLLIPTNRK